MKRLFSYLFERRLARRMVKKLLTMPDCTEVSTMEMVTITYNFRPFDSKWFCILKHPILFIQLLFTNFSNLDREFLRDARKNGYVTDGSKYYNTLVGRPYNIPVVFRSKENICKMFCKCEEKEIYENSEIQYHFRELVETDDICNTVMQLIRIPADCQTGHIDNTSCRSAAFVLEGEGSTEYSYWLYGNFYDDDHNGDKALWREFGERQEMTVCISDNSWCSYPCNTIDVDTEDPKPKTPWFSIKNIGKNDLILFVVMIKEFIDELPSK